MAQLIQLFQVSQVINVDLCQINSAAVISIDRLDSAIDWVRRAMGLQGHPRPDMV